jgi:hypothetical protein
MNRTDRFDETLSDWLHADAEHRAEHPMPSAPNQLRGQRPAWFAERWLP